MSTLHGGGIIRAELFFVSLVDAQLHEAESGQWQQEKHRLLCSVMGTFKLRNSEVFWLHTAERRGEMERKRTNKGNPLNVWKSENDGGPHVETAPWHASTTVFVAWVHVQLWFAAQWKWCLLQYVRPHAVKTKPTCYLAGKLDTMTQCWWELGHLNEKSAPNMNVFM